MEVRLLGEVELRAAGQLLDVGAPRPQAVLAALAVDAGRPVAIETLIDRVWADAPPVEVRNVLYSYLSRIRRLLRQAAALAGEAVVRIDRRHAGYVLDIDPDLVDLHRFRRLVDQDGDSRCDDGARAAVLAKALGLWRGPTLAGLPGKWAAQVRESWDRRRLDTVVQWAHIQLRLGHLAAVINTLPDLVAEYPLAEPLEALLMRALHAAGRGAEALDRYTVVRQRLADELGTDPGLELRVLYEAMLRGELPCPPLGPEVAPARTVQPAPPPNRPQPLEAPSGRTDTAPGRTGPTRRHAVLAALAAIIAIAGVGSVPAFHRDSGSPSASPSVEHAQELFAAAQKFHQAGRTRDAQETVADAVRFYDELIKVDPGQNAPALAAAVIQALGRAGVDFSVEEGALRSWLANPEFTAYPAISQMVLLRGWRLKAPVYLDVIVWNYEQAPGIVSPRSVADVKADVLEAAILEGSNTRYGTQTTDFEQLLDP